MTKRLTIALVAVALFVLLAVMPVSAAFYTVAQNVSYGATVFIGEQGLNLTNAYNVNAPNTTIGWWASAALLGTSAPTKSVDLTGRVDHFMVAPADFVGYTGNWYAVNPATGFAITAGGAFFNVADPTLDIRIWDFKQAADVTGKSVPQGEPLGFRIDTNMYSAINNIALRDPNVNSPINDGYIDIKVKDANGAIFTGLLNGSVTNAGFANSIVRQNVSFQPWIWSVAPSTYNPYYLISGDESTRYANWSTGATDRNGQYAYPVGVYTVYAESKLNAMKDNYKNGGADYTGKTVSAAYTITLVSDSVKIESNKDSVVRSKSFSVTVTGRPSTVYHLWVKGTSTMTGGYNDQPPTITPFQEGVKFDGQLVPPIVTPIVLPASYLAGAYQYENGAGKKIIEDVSHGQTVGYGSFLYANITTTPSGTRTVQWDTSNWTKAQRYTIRVEQRFPDTTPPQAPNAVGSSVKSDEVDVKVEKGAVTIVAAGDQSYYLGEEIKFSGTNTETYKTYLFIVGPNLPTQGADIKQDNPRFFGVVDYAIPTFKEVDVAGDNTWSWKWGTSTVALDAGTYTIYAVSQPRSAAIGSLADAAFGTVSIIIKKPFISATASQSTVAQGDKIFITGTAEGNPHSIKVWILGKNFPTNPSQVVDESVNADASFKHEVTQDTTRGMYPGQYFVVAQHPMQNDIFDVYPLVGLTADKAEVFNFQLNNPGGLGPGTKVFTLLGASSLQGSDAAEALVQAINDPNVDDTYTKLQFLVEVPVIRIDPIGDKHVGDKFTITAATNLAVDDDILVEVYSSSFKPTQKSQSGEFSGASGVVKAAKGDSGMNKITFDVDSSTFKPDEYIVTENAVIQQATATALFNVLEGAAPTAVPTKVVTVAPVVTTAAPVVTTAAPTAVPTTKSPGYGALIALIGLGAVAFIVVRRH